MRLSRFAPFMAASLVVGPVFSQVATTDPVLQTILDKGKHDNKAVHWNHVLADRFGGRITGSDAYNNAADWAVWQMKQWGMKAWKEEAGEVPVGFTRGPWFGKMITPTEKPLHFGTPAFTAGTKGVQRGPVVALPEAVAAFVAAGIAPRGQQPDPVKLAEAEKVALAAIEPLKESVKGAWVLWPGQSEGIAREGRKANPPSAVVKNLIAWGALGTIQSGKEPLRILDGMAARWEELPELPDIKLTEKQFQEIKELTDKGQKVELEFEIRNWFKLGPVKYHNVIGVLEGSEKPDEYVVLGGHLDSFDGGTGAVDDGNGVSTAMEAARLVAATGVRPKRSIMVILFAAEENGLVGSTAVLKAHPEWHDKIAIATARDGSPSAIMGFAVSSKWYDDFAKFTAPLKHYNPKFPFELRRSDYPQLRPTQGSSTDITLFPVHGIPTLNELGNSPLNNHDYMRTWHTRYDTFDEIAKYAEHQQHTAVVQAVYAYGVANLPNLLTREGYFLPDGLYADIQTTQGRVMASLDPVNVPAHTLHFLRMTEGKTPAPPMMFFGPGRQPPKPLGKVTDASARAWEVTLESDNAKAVADVVLSKKSNKAVGDPKNGLIGLGKGTRFVFSAIGKALPSGITPLGQVIAGADVLAKLKKGDEIRSVRILRAGEAAKALKADDAAFEAAKSSRQ